MSFTEEQFLQTCCTGCWEDVSSLMQRGAQLHWTDPGGLSALHYASVGNNMPVAGGLLEDHPDRPRMDANVRTSLGQTPLHLACAGGWSDIVELLIQKGADVMALDFQLETPLHMSSFLGHAAVVLRLVTLPEVDVNAQTLAGCSPFLMACHDGDADVARILVQHGADINLANACQITPLHIASLLKHVDILHLILERKGDVEAVDDQGRSPLHFACYCPREEITRALIDFGARVNCEDDRGQTALHYAVTANSVESARLLVQAGASVNAADLDGQSPLASAMEAGSLTLFQLLLQHGDKLSSALQCFSVECEDRNRDFFLTRAIDLLNDALTARGLCSFMISYILRQTCAAISHMRE